MKRYFFALGLMNVFVSAFGQVNLQTGSAVFNLPIFNWQDNHSRLNSAITLQYNSKNGLKVDEVASNIGQGWNLIAGGVITRMQVGQPDDQISSTVTNASLTNYMKYPDGYLINNGTGQIARGCPRALSYYPLFSQQNTAYSPMNSFTADRQKDYFAFQFNGRTGVFVLGANYNGTNHGILLGDSKLQVTFDISTGLASQNIRTTISGFHIQDENGLTYNFQDLGLTKMLRTKYCDNNGADNNGNPAFSETITPTFSGGNVYNQSGFDELSSSENPFVVGSWYLTSITDPLTNRSIFYSYNLEITSNYAGKTINAITVIPYSNQPNSTYIILSHNISVSQTPIISQIAYPDGYTVNFNYGSYRADLRGDKILNSVQVQYFGKTANQFVFNQSYFIGNQIRLPQINTENSIARLCLLSVQKFGTDLVTGDNPYKFTYYTGTDNVENCVPTPFSDFRDIGGYYNGNTAGVSMYNTIQRSFSDYYNLSFVHSFDPNVNSTAYPSLMIKPLYAENGLLQTIQYPTGGSITYAYAQNVGTYPGGSSDVTCPGVHVAQTLLHDGSNSTNADINTHYDYLLDNGNSSIWGIENPVNVYQGKTSYFAPSDQSDMYPGILYKEQSSNVYDYMNLIQTIITIGQGVIVALEISGIITKDLLGLGPVVLTVQVALDIVIGIIFPGLSEGVTKNTNTYNYYNYDLNSENPLTIQFKEVAVYSLNQSGSPGGKTIYKFSSPDQVSVLVSDLGSTFYSRRQRAFGWAYGLPMFTTIIDANGNNVKQTEFDYDWHSYIQNQIMDANGYNNYLSCDCYVTNQYSQDESVYTNNNNYTAQSITDYINVSTYNLYTGHVPLTDTYERSFQDDNNYLETHTNYSYDNNNYLPQKVTVTLSNGDQQVKEIYYAPDYTPIGVFQTMKNNNMCNVPIATYNSAIKSGTSTQTYLGASVTQYSTVSNGDIKPSEIFTGRSNQPIGAYALSPSNPFNYPNLIGTNFFEYDADGNLIKTQDEGGRVVTNIYDYNDKFIVATVINADPDANKVAYSSFENTNLPDHSNWIITGTPVYDNLHSITGIQGLILNEGNSSPVSISTNISIGKSYILSFWATAPVDQSGMPTATMVKTGPMINGMTYYEYAIPLGSVAPTIQGNTTIDELRLYPADARMSTSAYDPILGKISECDANNRVTYYSYDNLGRLIAVKDEYGNIIKSYEYNIRQTTGTPDHSNIILSTGTVYAQISYENAYQDAAGNEYADIVVRFYSDAACTFPISVKNLLVGFYLNENCDNGGPTYNQQYYQTVSGSSYVLLQGVFLLYQTTWQDQAGNQYPTNCNSDYLLTPSSNYTIE